MKEISYFGGYCVVEAGERGEGRKGGADEEVIREWLEERRGGRDGGEGMCCVGKLHEGQG